MRGPRALAATVLIPTFNHGSLLRYALDSALRQTVSNIEIFVVGDGAPPETKELLRSYCKEDKRITFFDNQKGPRHGELHRHEALKSAKGQVICYLSDDDLYLPHHIETQTNLLKTADFSNALPIVISAAGGFSGYLVDLNNKFYRELLLKSTNRIPLSCMAHRLSYYRKLPYGWRPAPKNVPTDLYMIQQFLRQADCRVNSGYEPTVLNLRDVERVGWDREKRANELQYWSIKVADPTFNTSLKSGVIKFLSIHSQNLEISKASLMSLLHMKDKHIRNIEAQISNTEAQLKETQIDYQLIRENRFVKVSLVFYRWFKRLREKLGLP